MPLFIGNWHWNAKVFTSRLGKFLSKSEARGGCPVFEAPFSLHTNQNCILCGNCIKNCQNQSPILNLRAPGHELWAFRRPDLTISVLGVFIMGSQIFRGWLKGSFLHQYAGGLSQPWMYYTASIIMATVLALLFVKITAAVVFDSVNAASQEKLGLMVYVLVPLMVAFELGFHFERMMVYGGQLLPTLSRQLGFSWGFLGISMDPALIKVIQIGLVLVGIAAAQSVLKRLLRSHWMPSLQRLSCKQRLPVWLLGAGYVWFFGVA
jgi:ferredoxin